VIFVSHTPEFWFQKSVVTSFSQLLPGYQKSTQTIWMCHTVYFNNMKRNLGHLSCTQGSPQPKDYIERSCTDTVSYMRNDQPGPRDGPKRPTRNNGWRPCANKSLRVGQQHSFEGRADVRDSLFQWSLQDGNLRRWPTGGSSWLYMWSVHRDRHTWCRTKEPL